MWMIAFCWIIDGFPKPWPYKPLKRSGFKFNSSKDSTIHRGYLVFGVVIGNANSGSGGLSDSDLVEIPSLKNITSIKIFH